MYGLCDCNNFYASCQRVFRPDLVGRPVVVLSNNDGCIIARSNEAKALGIGMGSRSIRYRGLSTGTAWPSFRPTSPSTAICRAV